MLNSFCHLLCSPLWWWVWGSFSTAVFTHLQLISLIVTSWCIKAQSSHTGCCPGAVALLGRKFQFWFVRSEVVFLCSGSSVCSSVCLLLISAFRLTDFILVAGRLAFGSCLAPRHNYLWLFQCCTVQSKSKDSTNGIMLICVINVWIYCMNYKIVSISAANTVAITWQCKFSLSLNPNRSNPFVR